MLAGGIPPNRSVPAGDSAGAALARALALRLRSQQACSAQLPGQPLPAGLALASPLADPSLSGASVTARAGIDPMVRRAWVAEGIKWYACPVDAGVHAPLATSLHGLPPMLIQVGEQEILYDDAARLAAHARECGVSCQFEDYAQRWHVFHLQAFYLRSAANAIGRLASFARACVDGAREETASSGAMPAALETDTPP